jgi:flagellar biogenesis protein FliO
MNLRKKIILWTLAIFIFGVQGQSDAANLVGLNLLENVSIDKKDDALTVRFIFRDPVQSYKPAVFYKKSAQIDLPSTYIEPAKKYFETEDSQIPQIYLAQFDSKTVRARFMFTEDGESKKDGIHIETRGNTLTVRINKKETDFLSRLLAETAQTVEAAELEENQRPAALANNVPATTEIVTQDNFNSKEITATNKVQPSTDITTPTTKKNDPSYFNLDQQGKSLDETPSILKLFAMLAIVLSFMLGLFYIFKKYVLKNTPFGNGERLVKVLGTGFIAPRKHIALVEVAGQILALGVSKDNISFLAEINNPEMIEKLKSNDSNNLAKQISNKFQKQKPGTPAPKASKADSQPVKGNTFNKYMQDFDDEKTDNKPNKEDSVAAVTRQIRRRMGNSRIA